MNDLNIFLLISIIGALFYKSKKDQSVSDFIFPVIENNTISAPAFWKTPEIGEIRNGEKVIYSGLMYEPHFITASKNFSIPGGVLSRLAWQESRYNTNAFNVGSGATGIMQIVPKWHPTVNATDPIASIYYSAKYLRQNYNRFGNWGAALGAYNWGPGNVAKAIDQYSTKWVDYAPAETKNYVRSIARDTGLTL